MPSFNISLILLLSCAQAVIPKPLSAQSLGLPSDSNIIADLSDDSAQLVAEESYTPNSGTTQSSNVDDPSPSSLNGRTSVIYYNGKWLICPIIDACEQATKQTKADKSKVCTNTKDQSQRICLDWESPDYQAAGDKPCGNWDNHAPLTFQWTTISGYVQYGKLNAYCPANLAFTQCSVCAEVIENLDGCVQSTKREGSVYSDNKGHSGVDAWQDYTNARVSCRT